MKHIVIYSLMSALLVFLGVRDFSLADENQVLKSIAHEQNKLIKKAIAVCMKKYTPVEEALELRVEK